MDSNLIEKLRSEFESKILSEPIRFIFVMMVVFFILAYIWINVAILLDGWVLLCGFAIPILFVASGVWFYGRAAPKHRTKVLKQIADDLGFEFVSQDEIEQLQYRLPLSFNLFHRGRRLGDFKNMGHGMSDNIEVTMFEYSYKTGRGGASRRRVRHHNYHVVCFQFDEPQLPTFSMDSRNVWHKIQTMSGNSDIRFEAHPEFTKKYWLNGADERAIRKIFTDDVIKLYEEHETAHTEALKNAFLYYRRADNVNPEKFRLLIEEGIKVLTMFHQALR